MLSSHNIIKGTALALAFGAVSVPAASAGPIADSPTQALFHKAPVVKTVPVAANPSKPGLIYSRQDKQLMPSGPSSVANPRAVVAPAGGMGETGAAAAFLAAHRLQTPAQSSAAATNPGDSFEWGDAGIGAAGGLVIALLGVGGGLALSQRRSRRTPTSAVVTG